MKTGKRVAITRTLSVTLLLAAGSGYAASVTGGGLTLAFDNAGALTQAVCRGTALPLSDAHGGIVVRELTGANLPGVGGSSIDEGFENAGSIDSWIRNVPLADTNVFFAATNGVAFTGSHSLHCAVAGVAATAGVQRARLVSPPVPVSTGTVYRVQCLYKADRGYLSAERNPVQTRTMYWEPSSYWHNSLSVYWCDADGIPLDGEREIGTFEGQALNWKAVGAEIVPPAGAVSLRVAITAKLDPWYEHESFFVDDVRVFESTASNAVVVGTLAETNGVLRFAGSTGALDVNAVWRGVSNAVDVAGTLSANDASNRALDLLISIPVDAWGWDWLDDTETTRRITNAVAYAHSVSADQQSFLPVSLYPYGGIASGERALATATPLAPPMLSELRYNAATRTMEICFHLALAPAFGHTNASFAARLGCPPDADAFRGVIAWYRDTYAASNTWFTSPFDVSAYTSTKKGSFIGNPQQCVEHDAQGIMSIQYSVPDFVVDRVCTELETPPTLTGLLALMDERQTSNIPSVASYYTDVMPRIQSASNGDPILKYLAQKEWTGTNVEGCLKIDPSPTGVSTGYHSWVENETLRPAFENTTAVTGVLDAVLLDNFLSRDSLNCATQHLAALSHTLTYAPGDYAPALPPAAGMSDYLAWLRDWLDANVPAPYRGIAINWWGMANPNACLPWIDLCAGEVNNAIVGGAFGKGTTTNFDPFILRYKRALAFHKMRGMAFAGSGITSNDVVDTFHTCLLYGIAGHFKEEAGKTQFVDITPEAAAALARDYAMLAVRLGQAGWEPLTRATHTNEHLFLERYGEPREQSFYIVAYNDHTNVVSDTVTLDERLGLSETPTVTELIDGNPVAIEGSGPAWTIAVTNLQPRRARVLHVTTAPMLENDHVRLTFHPSNYALTEMADKLNGFDVSFATNTPLWRMLSFDATALAGPVVWTQHFADVWATDAPVVATRNHYLEDTGPEQILHLDWTDVPLPFGGRATVNAEVRLSDDSPESVWSIDVRTTGSTDALWRVTFPVVLLNPIGGNAADDVAAVPIRSGLLVPNPHVNKVTGFSPFAPGGPRYGPSEIHPDAANVFKSALGGVHPGRWEMQWMHVYDGNTHNGVFLRSTDTNGYIKAITMFPLVSGTLLHWQHYPENNTSVARAYSPPYDVRLRPLSGDWFDSAKLYRSWLTSQVWCANGPLIDNPDFPHPDTNGLHVGAGITATEAAFTNVAALMDACLEWQTFFGADHGTCHPREWGGPVPYPHFSTFFTDAVAALNSNGWRSLPYTGSWLWNTSAGDDAAGTLEAAAGITLNGERNTELRWHAYAMCPAVTNWRDKYIALTDALLARGTTDQYCDLYPMARLCYATNHNHAGGGGNYWIEGYRAMVAEARAHTRTNHTDAAWMPEHRSELGLDLFDYYWVQYWTYLTNVFKGPVSAGVPVPIIAATVHDYIGCTSSAGEEHADFISAGGTPDGRLPWRFVQAWSFVNGNTMSHGVSGSPNAALSSPATRPDFLYLKDLKYHRAAALDYLLYGEFLRPPDTGSGTMDIPLWGRDYAQPLVLGGAFLAPDHSVGLFMSNYDPDNTCPATFTVDHTEYELTNGTYAIYSITPNGQSRYGGFRNADYHRKWSFDPGAVLMLRVCPAADNDGDGMGDDWESEFGVHDPYADSDVDGLTDLDEFQHGTHPGLSDTDGDGVSDRLEIADGTDPRNASSVVFRITSISSDGSNSVTLSWSDLGSNYFHTVDECTSLVDGAWTWAWGAGSSNNCTLVNAATSCFYRVRAVPTNEWMAPLWHRR